MGGINQNPRCCATFCATFIRNSGRPVAKGRNGCRVNTSNSRVAHRAPVWNEWKSDKSYF